MFSMLDRLSVGEAALVIASLNFLGIVVTAIGTYFNGRTARKNSEHLERVEININGKLHQLIVAEKGQSLAEGTAAGIAAERANPQVHNSDLR
jgi:hypothetical protein